jgi:hypothetical protein
MLQAICKSCRCGQQTHMFITTRTSTDSPLLRLPAELRNQIWAYTYGGLTIHVTAQNGLPLSLPKQLVWRQCVKDGAHQGRCRCFRTMNAKSNLVPIISKQFWAESSGIFFTSNTFHFQEAQPLRRLAISNPQFVERVSDIWITFQSLYPDDMRV